MTHEPERSHSHERVLAAPPDVVWKAITDPVELVRWFPLHASVAPGAGGRIVLGWGPGLEGVCRIERWEPPHHLRTSWLEGFHVEGLGSAERARLAVDWTLETRGGNTVLRLVHSGFGRGPGWDEEFDGTHRGWTFELDSLQHYLAYHRGRDRRAFWVRCRPNVPVEEAWRRLLGRDGLCREGSAGGLRAGDRFAFATAGDDALEGTIRLHAPPEEIAGVVDNLGRALFRAGVENCAGGRQAHVWFGTWGRPEAEVAALESRCRAMLERLFP